MKKLFILLIFIVPLTMCSCSGPIELRERAIVQALGIDYEGGQFILTLQEFQPESDGSEDDGDGILTRAEGKTVYEAVKNIEAKDGNQVFYGQSRLFIIGSGAAEYALEKIWEFMHSNYQISPGATVLMAEKKAADILKTRLFSGIVPDISAKRISSCGKAPDLSASDFLKSFYNLNGSGYLPVVLNDGEQDIKIEGCVVFSDFRPLAHLDEDETFGLCLLRGNVNDAVLTLHPEALSASVNIISQDAEITVKNPDERRPTLSICVNARGDISENALSHNSENSDDISERIKRETENELKRRAEKFLKATLEKNGCDPLGLLQAVKNKSSVKMRLSTEMSVNFSIRHAGVQIK